MNTKDLQFYYEADEIQDIVFKKGTSDEDTFLEEKDAFPDDIFDQVSEPASTLSKQPEKVQKQIREIRDINSLKGFSSYNGTSKTKFNSFVKQIKPFLDLPFMKKFKKLLIRMTSNNSLDNPQWDNRRLRKETGHKFFSNEGERGGTSSVVNTVMDQFRQAITYPDSEE